MAPVKARPIAPDASIVDDKTPGIVSLWTAASGYVGGFSFRCPCCGNHWGAVRFAKTGIPGGHTWDGNREAPSVSPEISLEVAGKPHWRGSLVSGEWRQV